MHWVFRLGLFLAVWFLIHTIAIVIDGFTDEVAQADVIVVLGNKVMPDGQPSQRLGWRLYTAQEIYEEGLAPKIIVSGGFGKEGHEEADAMKAYLVGRGVPAEDILLDRDGYSTYKTARNTRGIMDRLGWSKAIIVTEYFHISRTKMTFKRFGIPVVYSHHATWDLGKQDFISIPREFLAFYYYLCRSYPEGEEAGKVSSIPMGFTRRWRAAVKRWRGGLLRLVKRGRSGGSINNCWVMFSLKIPGVNAHSGNCCVGHYPDLFIRIRQ